MNKLCTCISLALLLMTVSTAASAAQDYNSSRSNNSSAVAAPDEVDNLLELSRTEAISVARSMLAVDGRDGYAGDYKITVDVKVTIERMPRGKSEEKRKR